MINPNAAEAQQIAVWRAKSLAGTLTLEEQRLAVEAMRQNRQNAAAANASSGKRSSSKKPVRAADDMLAELKM